MNPRSNFNITKLLFCPTGSYNDQYLRSFYLGENVDLQTLSVLQEVTKGGRNINPGILAPYSGQLLRPSADMTTQIQIANGYGEQRLRFMMEVESQAMGANLTTYVSGFTDYMGYHRVNSQNTVIDPNMKLFFDKTVTIQRSPYDTGHGMATRSNVIDTSHLLFGKYNPSFNADQEQVAMATRPEDIFSILEVSAQAGGEMYSDGRLLFADLLPKKSRLTNNLGNHFASTVLTNYRDSVLNAEGGMGTIGDAMQFAIGNVAEGVINEDPLFHAICRQLNFNEDGSITYGSLCMVCPHLDNVTGVTGGESKYMQALHQTGNTANLNASTVETIAATMVKDQVPALMADLFLTGISFTATNDTMGGEYVVEIAPTYNSFADMDMTRNIETFRQRLIANVLHGLSHNRMIKFHMSVMADMFGELYVNISINGGPITPHCFPAFAASGTAPVMSYNKEAVFGLVSDFEQIARSLDVAHSVQSTAPQHHQHSNQQLILPQSAGHNPHNPWEGQL